jgi:hypothetical protein
MKRSIGLVLALLLGLLPSAFTQTATGNIYGTVTDESGAVLPGATVRISSAFGNAETTSGSQGDFRFLNLTSGSYKITVALSGFTTVNREVGVNVGTNVNLSFAVKVATVEETVTVTAEAPIVDTKRVGTSTVLTKEELAQVPSARDPWAMLRTVPGVILDRVNIGGNENGQQAMVTSKGDNGNNVMWNLDGVVVTDTGSLGSPSYYDFDAFEEVAVGTGGNDVRAQTGGVNINLSTRRGTNAFHGSVHYFLTDDKFQSNNLPDELKKDSRLFGAPPNVTKTPAEKGDHINKIKDYGGEVGGPLVKDKLWFYGTWGKQDIDIIRLNQTHDKTQLTSYNAKLNWQAGPSDMVSVFYFNGEKTKQGRGVGTGLQEADTFLWDQGGNYAGNPHGFLKAEWNHTFSANFYMSAKASNYQTGFFLHPKGGEINGTADFDAGVARGVFLRVDNTRPAKTANLDASYFKAATGGNHEFKFGFGYRKFNVTTTTHWGGDGLFAYNFGPGSSYVHVNRDARNATTANYVSGYLGDTFTKDRLTLNLGVRYDRQKAGNLESSVPAASVFDPENPLLALSWDGTNVAGRSDNPAPEVRWKDVSPRVGITYAVDDARKTVLRASYARYAAQLPSGKASFFSPFASPGSYFAYQWDDVNGDGLPSVNEVRTDLGPLYFNYVNPNDPNGPSRNKLDPNYQAQHDQEIVVGIDRELFPNFAVSAAYTYRKGSDFEWTPRTGFTTTDYSCTTRTRNGFSSLGCSPNSQKVLDNGNSRTLTTRPDYSRKYSGLELTLMKRLSNRWMSRGAFTYNNTKEYLDSSAALGNPTRTDSSTALLSGPQLDGGLYAIRSSGSGKGDTIIGAKWQVIVNSLVQLPWNVELAGAFFARQGHPRPIIFSRTLGFDGSTRVLATGQEVETTRYPTVKNLDLRLAKNVKLGKSTVVLSGDVFNVFNANTELNRGRRASSAAYNPATKAGAFGRLDEILNPRVVRFGVRFQF